jgi:polyhydroxyalkanoate synthesis regulator phasin
VSVSRSAKLKIVGASLAALAVAGGGAALAATKPWSPHEESQALINDAAKQLGVTPTQLSDALKKALENRVDDAVASGRLTKAQGDELKKRIDSTDFPFPFFLGPKLGRPPLPFTFGFAAPFAKFAAAASYLGLSDSELGSKLAQGKTLAQIAKDEGKSVQGLVDALVSAAEKRIDSVVASGKLTKDQGEQLKSGLRDRMTRLVNGDLRFRRGPALFAPGFGFDFPRFRFAPGAPRFGPFFWPRHRPSA